MPAVTWDEDGPRPLPIEGRKCCDAHLIILPPGTSPRARITRAKDVTPRPWFSLFTDQPTPMTLTPIVPGQAAGSHRSVVPIS